jgi:hypothetical protein
VQVALAAALAASAAPLGAQFKSDWETEHEARSWREGEVVLPAYPKAANLVEFEVEGSRFRFFVDAASLSVGDDGVVRYTLVARSPGGAENVSYEGMRCKTRTARAYAFGEHRGRWSKAGTAWQPIERSSAQGGRFALWHDYFCPRSIAIANAAEGLAALRAAADR